MENEHSENKNFIPNIQPMVLDSGQPIGIISSKLVDESNMTQIKFISNPGLFEYGNEVSIFSRIIEKKDETIFYFFINPLSSYLLSNEINMRGFSTIIRSHQHIFKNSDLIKCNILGVSYDRVPIHFIENIINIIKSFDNKHLSRYQLEQTHFGGFFNINSEVELIKRS